MTKYEVTIEETKTYKFETDGGTLNEMNAIVEAARLVHRWKASGEPDKLAFTVREARG